MEPSKLCYLFLVCMLFISSATPILGCGSCDNPPPKKHKPGSGSGSGSKPAPKGPIVLPPIIGKPPVVLPPVVVPPIVKPPGLLPPVVVPPIVKPPGLLPPGIVPPVVKPPVALPPVTLPPIVKQPPVYVPPVTVPPISLPPVTVPPVITKPSPAAKPCPPSGKETCPIDTLKLGGCVDLLGGMVHIGIGDSAANKCCPVLKGLGEMEAALCLCTTLKYKALNLNIYVPLALELLMTCGKSPPPGYTCSL